MDVAIGLGRYSITDYDETLSWVLEAERLGVESVWSAEAWEHDGVTPLAYLAAKTERIKFGTGILQVGTRTPALLAMTAMSMHQLSGGRFKLGLGTSGPQVIEGWHGVRFDRPVTRTREIIEIVRKVMRGELLEYSGTLYELPLPGGEGKAIRSNAPPTPELPIYIASLGPKNLHLTGEIADGWLGTSFAPGSAETFLGPLRAGAEAAGRSLADLDLHAGGTVWFTDDVEEAAKQLRGGLAFSLGAMGSRRHNFYNDAYVRQGYADEAKEIQRLWIEGRRDEARERVPLEMVTDMNLIGTPEMVKQRLREYSEAGITTFRPGLRGETLAERVEALGQLMELVSEVSAEAAATV